MPFVDVETMRRWIMESGVSPEQADELMGALHRQHVEGREGESRMRAAYPTDFNLYAPGRFLDEDEAGWRKKAADAAEYVNRRLHEV